MKNNILLIRLIVLFLIGIIGLSSCSKENDISINERSVNSEVTKKDSNTPLLSYKLNTLTENDFILSTMKFYDIEGIERSLESLVDEPLYYFRVETTLKPTNYCCEVDFMGYYQALPFFPTSVIFTTEGYTDPNAASYFFQTKLYREIDGNWNLIFDHLWPDYERVCDGTVYGLGLVYNFGECPGNIKVFGAKGHVDGAGVLQYCTGDGGSFHYAGNGIPCW